MNCKGWFHPNRVHTYHENGEEEYKQVLDTKKIKKQIEKRVKLESKYKLLLSLKVFRTVRIFQNNIDLQKISENTISIKFLIFHISHKIYN